MNRDYTFRLLYDEDNGVYRTQCDELADVIDFACGKNYIEAIEKQLLGMADCMTHRGWNEPATVARLEGLRLTFVPECRFMDNWEGENHELYLKALNLLMHKHYGQKDKAGMDYYFHPVRVSARCVCEKKMAALLHDVLEDTDTTEEELRRLGFSAETVEAVVALTRKEGETYAEFIRRCERNATAHEVKIADLEDNMTLTRLTDLKENDLSRLNKYLHAWRYLNGLEPNVANIKE